MKGILLAGGTGSRLFPMTLGVNKHLLVIYDKPLIYYPLATLMLANIRDILLICRPQDEELFRNVLGDGSRLGITITYRHQDEPRGIPETFIIGRDFIEGHRCVLALGDNVFFGDDFRKILHRAASQERGATIFGYWVSDPQRFGVVEFESKHVADGINKVLSIEEKPRKPRSNYAVPGLYYYDEQVADVAAGLRPSARGELEITDVNRWYLERGLLNVIRLGRGFAWLDAGTADALLDASNYIATIERRQGLKIACIEEIAWYQGWIDKAQLVRLGEEIAKSTYGKYLLDLAASEFR
ncbi:MAG: glucose-1-phosphate thymidylyltransferase RfbA [Nitrospirae bacterium]|nr:glucose-1-phosphate thymidylyltransferase RfbA [Magnetococcales bacterium]